MLVPVLVLLACFAAGVICASRWLPDSASGPVGGLAFFTVVGLFSAALGIAGLHGYSIVRDLETGPSGGGLDRAEILADGLQALLLDAGMLIGLAGIVFLLAPAPDDEADAPSVSTDAP
jgi:hypothetical protein